MSFDPSKLKYRHENFIGVYENAFTKSECQDCIKLFDLYDKNGLCYCPLSETRKDLSISVNPIVELDLNHKVIRYFNDRFCNYIHPLYSLEYQILYEMVRHKPKYIKMQKTLPTQGFHNWHPELNGQNNDGQRVLSWILYLNDVDDGGETEFLYQSLRFKPKMGTFILFPAYFTHTHRGNPPLSGEKYIMTGWIEFLNTTELQGPLEIPNLEKITVKPNVNYK